jgi:type I restriction enzyme, R subunit
MNEADTRAQLIDPQLTTSGWGIREGARIWREYSVSRGRILAGGGSAAPLSADYVLEVHGRKLAAIEAKSDERPVGDGVAQAKNYADKLQLPFAFAVNGREIYQINMRTGQEGLVEAFPTPETLWNLAFEEQNAWREKFDRVPLEDFGRQRIPRYYQEIAVNKVMEAVADNQQRILLTMATGTGKTFIAFQIAWKLFQTRWNLGRDGSRRPRILFLTDRNFLADQAVNAFSPFGEDAIARFKPADIRKKGHVPMNASVFFTIFQTFMSGDGEQGYFGDYPRDFFDLIIIDECHRGGANDESNWRDIMEYFSPAVQLGLTATPRREENRDTYEYFGEPVYIYSLKEGINDGYLTPFKVKRIQTTLDNYTYTSDDQVIEGEVEQGREYTESDFNRIIEIKDREKHRVRLYLDNANHNDKAIIFCATQDHAAAVRDLINQLSDSTDPFYCARVTANDGALGEEYLQQFRDNERTIPTILTTSQKLSTGVDALNIRNIVLMRPINTMVEFKQIIGRGTRLFEGKYFFTIYDYVGASQHFHDPEWDGEPEPPDGEEPPIVVGEPQADENFEPGETEETIHRPMVKVKLADGKERRIQHMVGTSFWDADGRPLSVEEFLQKMYGELPGFFSSEDELRVIWSNPKTRKVLLERLANAGYDKSILGEIQALMDAQDSDLFDVLEYISYAVEPISREVRVARAQNSIFSPLNREQKEFLDFVLSKYIQTGVEELDEEKLPDLLKLKYKEIHDALAVLGDVQSVKDVFIGFQEKLYTQGT